MGVRTSRNGAPKAQAKSVFLSTRSFLLTAGSWLSRVTMAEWEDST